MAKGGMLGIGITLWQKFFNSGEVPYSLQFDGNDDYIEIPNHTSLQLTGSQTWAIWCKLENSSTGLRTVLGLQDSSTSRVKLRVTKRASNDATPSFQNQFNIGISQNGTQIGGGNTKNYYSIGLTTDIWCLVGFSFSANNLKIYVNGIELTVAAGTLNKFTDTTVNSLYNNTADPIKIGALNTSPSNFAKGYVDFGVVCNKALSGAEWAELYSKKPGSFPSASDFTFSQDIVSLWKIGENPDSWGTSGGITDEVGSNHGTMINFDPAGSFSTEVAI